MRHKSIDRLRRDQGNNGIDGGSQTYLYCPSRRKGPQYSIVDQYPVSDYAVPSFGHASCNHNSHQQTTTANCWNHAHDLRNQGGPMLLVHRTAPTTAWNNDVAKNYRSQTSFASMVDGLAYQAFFGEKSVHPRGLLTCDVQTAQDSQGGDCTVYTFVEGTALASGSARSSRHTLRRDAYQHHWNAFGSWHPNTCQFSMGDARVLRIKSWTHQRIVENITRRNDGRPVPAGDTIGS